LSEEGRKLLRCVDKVCQLATADLRRHPKRELEFGGHTFFEARHYEKN